MRHFTLISGLLIVMAISLPALSAKDETAPHRGGEPIWVGMDGPAIVRLDADAASVIVGNPAHASVALDDSRTVMVNAGAPGMTRLVVIGKEGQVILDRRVIVDASGAGNGADEDGENNGKFINVKNACINSDGVCQPNNVFYCVEGEKCHSVAPQDITNIRRRP